MGHPPTPHSSPKSGLEWATRQLFPLLEVTQ
jgi:hypothetical protein